MSQINNLTRQKLEKLFGMSGGYVLDFSNSSFADFIESCLGFDPNDKYEGSKAKIMRQIWERESWEEVAKLNLELLEHWRFERQSTNAELTSFEEQTYTDLKSYFSQPAESTSPADLEFLKKDFGEIDLSTLPNELTATQVVEARLVEIERCLEAEAPLAVIFLVGSTLEGLLMEVALANADTYISCDAAPKKQDKPRPLNAWTLAELIRVSRSLGVVGKDVLAHADHVREFRNYIHPGQQLKENFEPRMNTAQIAKQVLLATLTDLNDLGDLGP